MEMIAYTDWAAEKARLEADGRKAGLGIVSYVEGTGIGPYEGSRVQVQASGRVSVVTGVGTQGQGHMTVFAQIAADQLGVSVDDVRVVFGDTDHAYGFGSYSSRATVYCGGATILAARDVREKARTIAAHAMEVSPEDVELDDGQFTVRGSPANSMSWAEVSKLASHRPAKLPPGVDPGLDSMHKYMANEWGTFASAAHCAEVEVDIETGEVKILDYVIAEDCGTVVNPLGVEAQIQGGIGQGIGGTFLEDMYYDASGQLIAGTFMDYLLPGFTDVPDVEVYHQETPSPINVGGFKVSPIKVESALRETPGVADIRVYARRSSLAGQLVACDVMTESGHERGTVRAALLETARSALSPPERPRIVKFVERIDQTAALKVARGETGE